MALSVVLCSVTVLISVAAGFSSVLDYSEHTVKVVRMFPEGSSGLWIGCLRYHCHLRQLGRSGSRCSQRAGRERAWWGVEGGGREGGEVGGKG